MYSFLGGTPGARLMFVRPGVQVKPIECNTSEPHGNRNEVWSNVAFEYRRANAEIGRCLRGAKQPREKDRQHLAEPQQI